MGREGQQQVTPKFGQIEINYVHRVEGIRFDLSTASERRHLTQKLSFQWVASASKGADGADGKLFYLSASHLVQGNPIPFARLDSILI